MWYHNLQFEDCYWFRGGKNLSKLEIPLISGLYCIVKLSENHAYNSPIIFRRPQHDNNNKTVSTQCDESERSWSHISNPNVLITGLADTEFVDLTSRFSVTLSGYIIEVNIL